MEDEEKSKEQLVNELSELRQRIAQWEASAMELERTRVKLQESEERFRIIAETAKDALLMLDNEGRIAYWNPASEGIFGYTSQEAIGEELPIIIPERYHEDYRKGFAAFRETGKGPAIGKTVESEAVKKDGSEFPIELSVTAIRIKGQWHAVGIARNITDRKRAEEELREIVEKYRVLFDNERDAIMLVDLETQKFLEVNKATVDLYGYSREELLTMGVTDISAESEKSGLPIKQGVDQSTVKVPVLRHRKKDGTVFPAEISACGFMWKNRKTYCAIVRDITERKRAEEEKRKLESQLFHAQKMEALGILSSGVAHDFNNLLMGIQGNASLITLDIDSGHPHYERVKKIEQAVKSGADLTKQLLAFGMGGKYDMNSTDLNDVVNRTSTMFGRTKKAIRIHTTYQEDIWPVEVDEAQIDGVLLNLYIHASQAMPSGGDLYLETRNVGLDESHAQAYKLKPGKYVKISIIDMGGEMDEETQQRIFEPFFASRVMGTGTGFGLASFYGVIRHHGGIIDVHSKEGKGTTFDIYLPASEKEVAREKEPPEEVFRGKEAVLLVDDEDMIIDVGKQMLVTMGYRVLVARSGREAIEIYEKDKDEIDMIILDMVMPDMGGAETYDRIKEINPNTKVLLSSGYSVNGQAGKILERGCDGYIQKPFSMKELSRKIREILGE